MSPPYFGGPPGPAFLPPTHAVLPVDEMKALAHELRARAQAAESVLTVELIEGLARDEGVPPSYAYVAAAEIPELQVRRRADVAFAVCAAGCQGWGAVERLERLLELRDQRLAAGLASFDILPKGCVDRCMAAPVVLVSTPDGVGALPRNLPIDRYPAVVAHLCGDESDESDG